MKRLFLLIGVSVLFAALGFAQTPTPSSDTDQIAIKGCLSGSDHNYTVAEDNTGRILKLTDSSVDLKTHLDHDVKLVGHKANGAGISGSAENSLVVTELTMADAIRATGVRVVMGGPHVTEEADEALGRNGGPRHADAVALGEADETWPQIVNDAVRGELKEVYAPVDAMGKERKPALSSYPVIPWKPAGTRAGSSICVTACSSSCGSEMPPRFAPSECASRRPIVRTRSCCCVC